MVISVIRSIFCVEVEYFTDQGQIDRHNFRTVAYCIARLCPSINLAEFTSDVETDFSGLV
jgi:hypothetical protein